MSHDTDYVYGYNSKKEELHCLGWGTGFVNINVIQKSI